MNHVIKVRFYKRIIWLFPIILLYNSMLKQFGIHNLTGLYPNPSYKGTTLYFRQICEFLVLSVYLFVYMYSKIYVKWPLSKRSKMVFKTDYGLMWVKNIAECSYSAILSTFINLPFVIKTFVLSIFELLFFLGNDQINISYSTVKAV